MRKKVSPCYRLRHGRVAHYSYYFQAQPAANERKPGCKRGNETDRYFRRRGKLLTVNSVTSSQLIMPRRQTRRQKVREREIERERERQRFRRSPFWSLYMITNVWPFGVWYR